MMRIVRRLCLMVMLATGLGSASGCFGVSQTTSYFPFLLPTGDIIRTHGKPPGIGYFRNFDPHAVRLEVRPIEATNPVQTQHVFIATVYDEKGQPRRNRRVEWMLEGVGNIVEVDESGYFPGRGYKVDNRYAVSYTDYFEHRITRGNGDPHDDFVIRPGQTWCVVTSAVEGDTHMTVYCPEIHNWECHKVFVTKHWVDAHWELPPPAINPAGTEHVFTTRIHRQTDQRPLANYRVRYRILDGPPAIFLPERTQEKVAISDLNGNASVTLAQVAPAQGINRIGIEIIRAPDPTAPSGTAMVIGRGETTKEWQAPQIQLSKNAPPAVGLGQEIPYTLTVTNTGKVETKAATVRDMPGEGLQYVRSEPSGTVDGNQVIWTLGEMRGGQSQSIQVWCRALRAGPVTNCAVVATPEGLRDEKCVTTQVTVAQLKVTKTGPATGVVGMPVTYQVVVTNPGSGPATNVVLTDEFDAGLEHASKANPIKLEIGTLAAGESKTYPVTLTPRQVGRVVNRVVATADGNLRDQAEHPITVQTAQLKVEKSGPARRYVNREATWDIRLTNPGEVPLNNVSVRDQLPPELVFVSAGQGGTQAANGEVVWNLGTLQPREQKIVQVTTRCVKMTPRALNVAIASADPGMQVQSEAAIEIDGLPALRLECVDLRDPVEVGGRTIYKIDVTNQGTLPGDQVRIVATIPPQMRAVGGNGPTQPVVDGQQVLFPPINDVQPGQKLTYQIEVEALQPGDARFKVELFTGTSRDPVREEESTTVMPALGTTPPAPRPAAPAPAAPRAPMGSTSGFGPVAPISGSGGNGPVPIPIVPPPAAAPGVGTSTNPGRVPIATSVPAPSPAPLATSNSPPPVPPPSTSPTTFTVPVAPMAPPSTNPTGFAVPPVAPPGPNPTGLAVPAAPVTLPGGNPAGFAAPVAPPVGNPASMPRAGAAPAAPVPAPMLAPVAAPLVAPAPFPVPAPVPPRMMP